jgi:predicted small metal-binding protein
MSIDNEFDYIMAECERQWNENQKEEHGEWFLQADDTKAEYYNDMAKHLRETGKLPEFPESEIDKIFDEIEE